MRKIIFWLTLVLAMGLFANTSAFAADGHDKHKPKSVLDADDGHDKDNPESDLDGQPKSVPEPASIIMLGAGLLGVGAIVRRKLGK